MTEPIAPLASVSIDCPASRALAPFHRSLPGLTEVFAAPDVSVVALAGAGPMITLMRADDDVAPQWPDGPQRQQMHLDLAAEARHRGPGCARDRRPHVPVRVQLGGLRVHDGDVREHELPGQGRGGEIGRGGGAGPHGCALCPPGGATQCAFDELAAGGAGARCVFPQVNASD